MKQIRMKPLGYFATLKASLLFKILQNLWIQATKLLLRNLQETSKLLAFLLKWEFWKEGTISKQVLYQILQEL